MDKKAIQITDLHFSSLLEVKQQETEIMETYPWWFVVHKCRGHRSCSVVFEVGGSWEDNQNLQGIPVAFQVVMKAEITHIPGSTTPYVTCLDICNK